MFRTPSHIACGKWEYVLGAQYMPDNRTHGDFVNLFICMLHIGALCRASLSYACGGLKHFITVFLRFVFLLSGIFYTFNFYRMWIVPKMVRAYWMVNSKGCKRIMFAGLLDIGLREPWAHSGKFGDQIWIKFWANADWILSKFVLNLELICIKFWANSY